MFTEKIDTPVINVKSRSAVNEPRMPSAPMAKGRLAAVTLPKIMRSKTSRTGQRERFGVTDVGARELADHLVGRHQTTDLVGEAVRREIVLDVVVVRLSRIVARPGELDDHVGLATFRAEEGVRTSGPVRRVRPHVGPRQSRERGVHRVLGFR